MIDLDDIPPPVGHHRCRMCREILPAERFYPYRLRQRQLVCKPCDNAARQARIKADPARRAKETARKARWRAAQYAQRDPRPPRPRVRFRDERTHVLPDEYCAVCDCWFSPHGIVTHERRHIRERAA